MGNGDDTAAAAKQLRLLNEYFREHPVTSPAGHSYISGEPRATATAPGLPYNAAVTDHIAATVRELADYTREVVPEAGPLPRQVQDVYRWCIEHTANAPEAVQQRRDTIVYRQHLDHAIAMGDTKVVRPHRCPECRTFGLMWVAAAGHAVCTNGDCVTDGGLSNTFTTARLAYEHVAAQAAQKSSRVHAT